MRAYLDIETTGLSPRYADMTVIGVALENGPQCEVVQFVGDAIDAARLLDALREVAVLYTYNGARFDLPFVREKLGIDLADSCDHRDLMYACWDRDLYGGLKAVERRLGIPRELQDVDGRIAVDLWYRYKRFNDETALQTLLRYNREDVLNLAVLREKLEA